MKSRVTLFVVGLLTAAAAVFSLMTVVGNASNGSGLTIDPSVLPAQTVDHKLAKNTPPGPPEAPKPIADPPSSENGVLTGKGGNKYVPHQIVVRYEASASAAQRAAVRRELGATVNSSLPVPDTQLLTLPKDMTVAAAAKQLATLESVKYGEPNYVVHATATIPDDTLFNQQWSLNNTGQNSGVTDADIDATDAWDTTTGSQDVVVAIIDTGIDYLHSELAPNIWQNPLDPDNGIDDDANGKIDDWRGWDWANNDKDPMDDHFHGTHVAGTVGAIGNNNAGVAGVAWNTKLMPLKFLDESGSGSLADGAAAMAYAAEHGARIVNGSFGYNAIEPSQFEADVIAAHPETLFVFAAGNSYLNNDGEYAGYPCSHPATNIVCVAASDSRDGKPDFSNYGKKSVDLAAPGVGILSTKASVYTSVTGQYASFSGTSMASPHVAGAAALLLAANPTATTEDLKDGLLSGVDENAAYKGKVVTDGRLNVNGSLAAMTFAMNQSNNTVRVSGEGTLLYRAAAGQPNHVVITEDSHNVTLTDPGNTLTAGKNCFNVSPTQVNCDRSKVARITVSTSDSDDTVAASLALPTYVDLGDGNDSANTGAGDDVLLGGLGSDVLRGHEGNDTADYSASTAALNISLDGVANDGAAGELDDVGGDIENAIGGSGSDQLTAGSASATLDGRAGDDVITGGAGDDVLKDGAGSDSLVGGLGDDHLVVTAANGDDVVSGGDGTDTADYGEQALPNGGVVAALDGLATDGVSGEHDDLQEDVENIIGSSKDDVLHGNTGSNVLSGGYGNDYITGRDGSDSLEGGSGSDQLDGGQGADIIAGGSGTDYGDYRQRTADVSVSLDEVANDGEAGEGDMLESDVEDLGTGAGNDTLAGNFEYNDLYGGAGNDSLSGGEGSDRLLGEAGTDSISGDSGLDKADYDGRPESLNLSIDGVANDGASGENDNIHTDIEWVEGGFGDDTITGSLGDDWLNGSKGNDTFYGNDGNDVILAGNKYYEANGTDSMSGGAGSDTVNYSAQKSPVTATLDGLANDGAAGENDLIQTDVENITGGSGLNTLTGDDGPNVLTGAFFESEDTIHGGAGDDVINGYGWAGSDDHLYGDDGNDEVIAGYIWDLVAPTRRFPNQFDGNGDVHGGAGDDKVYGGWGGSQLFGDDGDDILQGFFRDDQFSGGDGNDTVAYHYSALAVNISLDGVANDGTQVPNQYYPVEHDAIGTDVENLIGSFEADVITGDANANKLSGGQDSDVISGFGGDDTLHGGHGIDTINGSDGSDQISALDGDVDAVNCGDGADSVKHDPNDDLAGDCEPTGQSARVELRHEWSDADLIEFRALDGVANNVLVTRSGATYTFSDPVAAVEAGQGCVQVDTNTASCSDPNNILYEIDVNTLDGNDTITVDPSVDRNTRLDGGVGDDVLHGGSGTDALIGGEGTDQLFGGIGQDVADYSAKSLAVSLTPDGNANDGALGEGDNIAIDVEDLTGGNGNDILTGNEFENWLRGNGGADIMRGNEGNDIFIGGDGSDVDTVTYDERTQPVQITQTDYPPLIFLYPKDQNKYRSGEAGEFDGVARDIERFVGGSGSDTIGCQIVPEVTVDGGPGADAIRDCQTADYGARTEGVTTSFDGVANDGEAGENDNLDVGVRNVTSGSGNDSLTGDSNPNAVISGTGDDQINISDPSADSADCGDGADSISADSSDTIDDNCETVQGGNSTVAVSGSKITFGGAPRATNDVTFSDDAGKIVVADTAANVDPGYGCVTLTARSATCNAPDGATIIASTGDQNDSIVNQSALAMTANAGSGNDELLGGPSADHLAGGTGDDTLAGGLGADTLDGGTGSDTANYEARSADLSLTLDGVANDGATGENDAIGSDIENLHGGAGDDVLVGDSHDNVLAGGDGTDTANYSAISQPLNLSLDGTANDGAYGETDNIQPDIENLTGGSGYDTISGSAGVNVLDGGDGGGAINGNDGSDSLLGGNGDDTLDGGVGSDTLTGGGGTDATSYASHTEDVNVSLDGIANDGASGENDDVQADIESATGGAGNDTLTGDAANNQLNGGPGNDTLDGGLGADTTLGGDGIDTVDYSDRTADLSITTSDYAANDGEAGENDNVDSGIEHVLGGSGNDTLTAATSANLSFDGNAGDDTIQGGWGNDALSGGPGDDTITDQGGDNVVNGGDGADSINGSYGVDQIDGGDGNDQLTGSGGNDALTGNAGDDTFTSAYYDGSDAMAGGDGTDIVNYSSISQPLNLSLDGIANDGAYYETDSIQSDIENLTGGSAYDTISGNAGVNVLDGGDGGDTINGSDGNDSLIGGSGDDTLDGGVGSDTLVGGSGMDATSYASRSENVNVSLDGTANDGASGENDDVQADVESATGGTGDDTLTGGTADNRLNGGLGNDTLDGGLGADTTLGGDGFDTVDYSARTADLSITTSDGLANDGEAGEGDNVNSELERILGGSGNDTLTTSGWVDLSIAGNAGNDTIQGGSGNDQITGGPGDDTIADQGGNNVINGGDGADSLNGSYGDDQINGDNGHDQLAGGSGNDVVTGDAGDDTLTSVEWDGNDTLVGSAGDDTFQAAFYDGSDVVSGGDGTDTANYSAVSQPVSLSLDGIANDGGYYEPDNIQSDIENLTGGSSDDSILGNSGANVLDGGAGNDNLDGGAGADSLVGGSGTDATSYASRSENVNVSLDGIANDGASGENDDALADVENATGGNGDDTLTGGTADNRLSGGPGNDTLDGGLGADTTLGGDGFDTLDYSARTADLSITTSDDLANDGEAGEGDNVNSELERILGGSGNDMLTISGGADLNIEGNAGNDTVQSGWGNDQVNGGPGDDTITDQGGNDVINGDDGADSLNGSSGDDQLDGGNGNDQLTGSYGSDTVTGGEGDDTLASIDNDNDDALSGNAGDDTFTSAYYDGNDAVTGGDGTDTANYSAILHQVNLSLDGIANDGAYYEADNIQSDIENLTGGSNYDTISGNAAVNVLEGGDGGDTINGSDGSDSLLGGNGDDTLDGGAGSDTLAGGSGTDATSYASRSENVNVSLDGIANDGTSGENDDVQADVENATGGSGDDTLTGRAADNRLNGGPGNDAFDGGLGGDTMLGGDGFDRVDYSARTADLSITTSDYLANDGEAGEGDNIDAELEHLVGGSGNDTFTTSSGADLNIEGNAGNDTIQSGWGNDQVTGGPGDDTITDQAGNDVINGGDGADSLNGSSGDDQLDGGNGNDQLTGSYGSDTVTGSEGDDTLTSIDSDSNDALFGNAGDDTFTSAYYDGNDVVNGGDGTDTATYSAISSQVNLSLDGIANDGAYYEVDNIQPDIENLTGGSGYDTISGSAGVNVLEGGGGDDTLDGGAGSDSLAGGSGTDATSYASRSENVSVSLDGIANDGTSGENDDVQADVENATGGTGDDTLIGGSANNRLDGGLGADLIDGGLGADVMIGSGGFDTVDYSARTEDISGNINSSGGGAVGEYDTIYGDIERLFGGSGNDTFTAAYYASATLVGGAGNDSLSGGNENDTIIGGDGSDVIYAYYGDDSIDSGAGDDSASGGVGNDSVTLGDGDDYATDEAGQNTIAGNDGNDSVNTYGGDSEITGGSGDDTLRGGNGYDTIDGGIGNDALIGGYGTDHLVGGSGADSASYEDHAEVTVTANGVADDGEVGENDDIGTDIETIVGSSSDDVLVGGSYPVTLVGSYGNDTLSGGTGGATLNGSEENDTLISGPGSDTLIGGSESDVADYSARTASLDVSADGAANDGEAAENDNLVDDIEVISGGSGADTLAGGSSNLTLNGNAGADTLQGGSGVDRLDGGTGADVLQGGGGIDNAYYGARTASVNVKLDGNGDSGEAGEADSIASDVETGIGGAGADTLTGSSGNNTLNGLGGSDTIDGGGGADSMSGGVGADVVTYASRSGSVTVTGENTANDGEVGEADNVRSDVENVTGGSGNDTITGTTSANLIVGGMGNDTINGGRGADTLVGEDGNDSLLPGDVDGVTTENDMLNGGAGSDTAKYTSHTSGPVFLSPDDVNNDGLGGEHDNINSDVENLTGGGGGDTLTGTAGDNTLIGGSGNDTLQSGAGGSDVLQGDSGTDTAYYSLRTTGVTADNDGVADDGATGETGNLKADVEKFNGSPFADTLTMFTAGAGTPTINGGDGDDTLISHHPTQATLYGDQGNDTLLADTGSNNLLSGDDGNDVLTSGNGHDNLYGENGDDTLNGGNGNDYMLGSIGNDTLIGGYGTDNLQAGAGDDFVNSADGEVDESSCGADNDQAKGDSVDGINSSVYDCEEVTYPALLQLFPDPQNAQFYFDSSASADNDDLTVSHSSSSYTFHNSGLSIVAASNTGCTQVDDSTLTCPDEGVSMILVAVGAGDDSVNIDASVGSETLIDGSDGNDTLSGGSGVDSLVGGAGINTFDGNAGNDYLWPSDDPTSADELNGGSGTDEAHYDSRGDDIELSSNDVADDGAAGEGDNLGSDIERIFSGSGNDTITGSAGDEELYAGGGNDVIDGSAGSDSLDGSLGDDTIESRDGVVDVVSCGEGADTAAVDQIDTLNILEPDCEALGGTPDTSIDSGPADGSYVVVTSAVFSFSSDQPAATFSCSFDGAPYSTCSSSTQWAGLGEGQHTFAVRASDTHNNVDLTPVERTFTVDSLAPTVSVTAPSGAFSSSSVIVNFTTGDTGSGVDPAQTKCTLGATVIQPCTSGDSISSADGSNLQVTVSTEDYAGNAGVGVSPPFTVDTTPPDTAIDSGPSGYTPGNSPTFTFHGDPAGDVAEFECSIDGAPFTACTSPKQYIGLSQTAHTFLVRAKDAVGNADPTPAPANFTVDYVQPAVSITAPLSLQASSTPQATFTVVDASPVVNTCKVDYVVIATCSNGMNLPSQAEGQHNFSVTAVDAAGNALTSSVNFVVDTTAPDVSISGSTLNVTTSTGFNNGINMFESGSTFTVNEGLAPSIKAGTGCVNVTAVQVTCADTGVTAINVDLGDGTDNFSVGGGITAATTISGGAGNDSLHGGSANDTIIGGTGADYMTGGAGTDTVSYVDHTAAVTASVDGNTDNGVPGEGDSSQPDIENIIGGSGNDLLRSNSSNNVLNGGAGTDTVTFAGISAAINANLSTGVATGAGTDTLTAVENLVGGTGADTLTGDAANNTIDGGAGASIDTINGGTGTNTVSYASAPSAVTVTLATTPGSSSGGAGADSLTSIQNVTGSAFNDTITGSTAANAIDGAGGTDTVSYAAITTAVTVNLLTGVASGGGGADTLTGLENVTGGTAADNITGDGGNNSFIGGTGTTVDTINGGAGTDTVNYSANTATVTVNLSTGAVTGAAGADVLSNMEGAIGGTGADTITASAADNVIDGGAGTDLLTYAGTTLGVAVNLASTAAQATGGSGTETITNIENLTGGTGNDTLQGTSGNNTLNGGTGTNTVSYANTTANVTVNLATTTAQATGGAGSDTLGSGTFANLTGGSGNDTLTGTTGANAINGGLGTDTVSYSAITSAVTVNLTTGVASGGGGADTLSGLENVTTGSGGDTITGTTSNNVLNAGSGTDTVVYSDATTDINVNLTTASATGGAGTDTVTAFERVTGGSGNDVLTGTTAANIINGAGGTDTVSYAAITTAVTVNLTTNTTSGGGGVDPLTSIENAIGGTAADTLTGGTGDNVLEGRAGNDIINGNGGLDTVNYSAATAAVTVNLATTTSQNTVGAGSDTITNTENLTGSNFNDTLTGNAIANTITGGGGVDTVNAGDGNDIIFIRDLLNDANTVCGLGTDVLNADTTAIGDTNSSGDCETASRS